MSLVRRVLIAIFACIGAVLSYFSIDQHVSFYLLPGKAASFCHISEQLNCAAIISSPYSVLFGYPLGSYGIVYFLSLVLLVWRAGGTRGGKNSNIAVLVWCFSLVALCLSVLLFLLSKFVIGALCPVCLSIYAVNVVIFLIAFGLGKGNTDPALVIRAITNLITPAPLGLLSLIAFVLIVGAGVYVPRLITKERLKEVEELGKSEFEQWLQAPKQSIPLNLEPGPRTDYFQGSVTAPIRVVEFSDFECPACRVFSQVLHGLVKEFGDRVLFVHMDFPIDNSCNPLIPQKAHEHACAMALTARCAGEQGKFWEVADYLFTLPEIDDQASSAEIGAAITAVAEKFGLDSSAIQECRESSRQVEKLRESIKLAESLVLHSTPSVWVDGKKLPKVNEQILRRAIERALTQ